MVEEISCVYESDECGCVGLSGKRGTQAKKFSLNVEIQIMFFI